MIEVTEQGPISHVVRNLEVHLYSQLDNKPKCFIEAVLSLKLWVSRHFCEDQELVFARIDKNNFQ